MLFNPETELGRKTMAVASTVNNVVHQINIAQKNLTPLQWKGVISMLNLQPLDLLNEEHPLYKQYIEGRDFSEADMLEVLFHYPELVKGPIGIHQNTAVLCDDPKDILRLDLTPAAEQAAYG